MNENFLHIKELVQEEKELMKTNREGPSPCFFILFTKKSKARPLCKISATSIIPSSRTLFLLQEKKSFFFWSSSFKSSNYQTKHAISRHNQQENTPSTKTTETNLIIVAFLCERLEKLENQIHKLALVGSTKGWRYRERVCVCVYS